MMSTTRVTLRPSFRVMKTLCSHLFRAAYWLATPRGLVSLARWSRHEAQRCERTRAMPSSSVAMVRHPFSCSSLATKLGFSLRESTRT
jgi:hypothetical protein